ncbi:MAG: IS110 family transposase [Bifidobacteriaceae bacterium]|nr:IS110 family transposase [Bifidobacteriaceae bacterium]
MDRHQLRWVVDLLPAIPGAVNIIVETGADMDRFPAPAKLASWAGVCRGQHESAGKAKPVHARPGTLTSKALSGSPRWPPQGQRHLSSGPLPPCQVTVRAGAGLGCRAAHDDHRGVAHPAGPRAVPRTWPGPLFRHP